MHISLRAQVCGNFTLLSYLIGGLDRTSDWKAAFRILHAFFYYLQATCATIITYGNVVILNY